MAFGPAACTRRAAIAKTTAREPGCQPRRTLHSRIADTLERQFPEIAANQPELLARHWTEAGVIERASGLWANAARRSLARSALVEAAEQLARSIDQMARLPGTPTLRRQQIELQIALFNTLFQVKGFAAPESKAAVQRAHLFIQQAEALGETPEDPLPVFSVLFGFWLISQVAFNGDDMRKLALDTVRRTHVEVCT